LILRFLETALNDKLSLWNIAQTGYLELIGNKLMVSAKVKCVKISERAQ
jgi:hypothetical protein